MNNFPIYLAISAMILCAYYAGRVHANRQHAKTFCHILEATLVMVSELRKYVDAVEQLKVKVEQLK